MKTFLVRSVLVLAFALAGIFVNSNVVFAVDPADNLEEIIVRAPITIERTEVRDMSTTLHGKVEIVELKRHVSIADLDLSREEDIRTMERRIEAVAKDSCQKLSDMFPLDPSDFFEMKRCTKDAIESALGDKNMAIASAN